MERETKELKIDGHVFVVKTYATAREAQSIQQAYFKGTKVEMVGTDPKISEFNPGVQFDVQEEMIRQMVVSLDGQTANVAEACLELPNEIYTELVSQLDTIVAKKKT